MIWYNLTYIQKSLYLSDQQKNAGYSRVNLTHAISNNISNRN